MLSLLLKTKTVASQKLYISGYKHRIYYRFRSTWILLIYMTAEYYKLLDHYALKEWSLKYFLNKNQTSSYTVDSNDSINIYKFISISI